MRPARHGFWLFLVVTLAATQPSAAEAPILHEPIPPDPKDDMAQSVALDGDLPAAIETPSGIVAAPDPRRPIAPTDRPSDAPIDLQSHNTSFPPDMTFTPDDDTRRPEVLNYDDPFTPSTAPFKRLAAFDAVGPSLALTVRDPRQTLFVIGTPAGDGSEEQFYGDIVVDIQPGKRVRIPTVGPGAKVVRARLGIGRTDIGFRLYRDGADNWFLEGDRPGRARFVVELSIARKTFGGELGDPGWSDLAGVAPLPPKLGEEANKVALTIGASRAQSPRENVKKLVAYFRGFTDSNDPPRGEGDVYLRLALSKKGVCRHRAYAFLVTALGLGIPTRMVINEAHAWVEVNDGALWRRIDLGGAGRALNESLASEVPYEAPPDPFAWPPDAARGDDLVEKARAAASLQSGGPQRAGGGNRANSAAAASSAATHDPRSPTATDSPSARDDRPPAELTLATVESDTRRGAPLHVRGRVRADGEPCANIVVDVLLRDAKDHARERFLGTLATGEDGTFAGALIVPSGVPLGDYEIVARSPGDLRCSAGATP